MSLYDLKEKIEDILVLIIFHCICKPYIRNKDKLIQLLLFAHQKYDKFNKWLVQRIFHVYKKIKNHKEKKANLKSRKEECLKNILIEND